MIAMAGSARRCRTGSGGAGRVGWIDIHITRMRAEFGGERAHWGRCGDDKWKRGPRGCDLTQNGGYRGPQTSDCTTMLAGMTAMATTHMPTEFGGETHMLGVVRQRNVYIVLLRFR